MTALHETSGTKRAGKMLGVIDEDHSRLRRRFSSVGRKKEKEFPPGGGWEPPPPLPAFPTGPLGSVHHLTGMCGDDADPDTLNSVRSFWGFPWVWPPHCAPDRPDRCRACAANQAASRCICSSSSCAVHTITAMIRQCALRAGTRHARVYRRGR